MAVYAHVYARTRGKRWIEPRELSEGVLRWLRSMRTKARAELTRRLRDNVSQPPGDPP